MTDKTPPGRELPDAGNTEKKPRAVIFFSEVFRGHHYGKNHPLNIPRVALTVDLIETYQALSRSEKQTARPATLDELSRFHSRPYLAALKKCQAKGRAGPDMRQQFNLGNFENPLFEKMFDVPALAAGAGIQGAQKVLDGIMAFNPAGGMHHAMPEKARGFCFINDVVLTILTLRRAGLRVLYFDMDAHHGDGVETAFDPDPDTLTLSFHMDTDYAYPRKGGQIKDIGTARTSVNLPLPKGANDTEYQLAFETIWPLVMTRFQPDAIVLQAGTDILFQDPLGAFSISNTLFFDIVQKILTSSPGHPDGRPRLMITGGGGYHPIALARCWTGLWSLLAGWDLPDAIPATGRKMLQHLRWTEEEEADPGTTAAQYTRRLDPPMPGPVRDDMSQRLEYLCQSHPLLA